MNREFKDAIENSPIIAAIKNDAELHQCLTCDSQVIFILYGDICNIADIVDTVKSSGKIAMVHLDLINGLSSKEIAVFCIKEILILFFAKSAKILLKCSSAIKEKSRVEIRNKF